MKNTKCDFQGWCTKANIKCSDGRTIMKNAFIESDGEQVPLVWNHQHDSVSNILGHAILENREDDGVWAYCYLNDTEQGKSAKEDIRHGDITDLSIFANNLIEEGSNVVHGIIREVSLVLAGSNPGASIVPVLVHGEEIGNAGIIYMGGEQELMINEEPVIEHSDISINTDKEESVNVDDEKETKTKTETMNLKKFMDSLNEEQTEFFKAVVGKALADGAASVSEKKTEDKTEDKTEKKDENNEEENTMKHNVFDGGAAYVGRDYDAEKAVLKDLKRAGSLKDAMIEHGISMEPTADGGYLMHSDTDPSTVASETQKTYGVDHTSLQDQDYFVNDPSFLFPEARELNNTPAFIQRKIDWVSGVIGGTKHTPFARVKTRFADITEDEARAKGYIKGKQKKDEVFTLLKRTTTPCTVYKRQKFDRDDIIDITDFDVVAWVRNEMRMMLNEELARAILFGDGRSTASDDKISETNIRPVWTDDDLFTIHKVMSFAGNDDEDAKTMIKAAVKARKDYRGSGNPVAYMTEDMLTNMLLLEDGIGHRLYKTEGEVASAMRVNNIVTVPVMENLTRTVDSQERTLQALILNLGDYTVGTDRGGEIKSFEDFDINYNQQIYLLETRCSGALTVPYSAICLESVVSTSSSEAEG